jgi:hypothetical protein
MRTFFLLIICLLSITSCNQVNDLQVVVPEAVPSSVIKQVTDRFPLAENLVFKSLVEKQIWEVKFNSEKDRYVSLVDSIQMSQTFRFNSDEIPVEITNMLGKGAFKGGIISQNMEDIGFYTTPNRRNKGIYTLNGQDYVLDWLHLSTGTTNLLVSSVLYSFAGPELALLPAKMRDFFKSNPDLTFDYAGISIFLNYEKQFDVQVSFDRDGQRVIGRMLFDADGNLKWVTRAFNEPASPQDPTNVSEMPEAMRRYLDASPELAEFYTLPTAEFLWRGEYKGYSGYTIRYAHKTTLEMCEMYFDKDGKLLLKAYYDGY